MADGLFEQLTGIGETGKQIRRVSSHDLVAMVSEVQRGIVVAADAKASLGLTDQAAADVGGIVTEVEAGRISAAEVRDVLDLVASRRAPYDDKTFTRTRLGL